MEKTKKKPSTVAKVGSAMVGSGLGFTGGLVAAGVAANLATRRYIGERKRLNKGIL